MDRGGHFTARSMLAALTGLFGLTLAGCVTAPVSVDRAAFAAAPARNAIPPGPVTLRPSGTLLLDVRLDRQVAGNGCGAHAVAALIDYWDRVLPTEGRGAAPSGSDLYSRTPPEAAAGYSLAELVRLLEAEGMSALVVTTTSTALKAELEAGRPVIVRVSLAASQVRPSTIFPERTPFLAGLETRAFDLSSRVAGEGRLDHYWLVVGFDSDRMVVLDPAMGLRAVRTGEFEAAVTAGGNLAVVSGGPRQAAP